MIAWILWNKMGAAVITLTLLLVLWKALFGAEWISWPWVLGPSLTIIVITFACGYVMRRYSVDSEWL